MATGLIAITRGVSAAIEACELSFLDRLNIDLERARAQHRAYEECLRQLGATVISLPSDPGLPDAVFVEDPAVVVDEVAIVTRMGAASRRAESDSLAEVLARFRPVRRMEQPATLEGGDVLQAGRRIFAGISTRSNREGYRQLGAILTPFGYDVQAVEVAGCLHLKTAVSYLGEGTMLANREWVDAAAFAEYRILDVAEPWAANVLPVGGTVLMADGFPETRRRVESAGWTVQTIDISELMKAEAGLTCMSLLFSPPATP